MKEAVKGLRWGVERRLEFIEFRLFWEGRLNRADLMEFFGVSVPQASKDLSQYQELAPGNMSYDKSEKRYLAAATFHPRFFEPDADRYLSQLRQIAERTVPAEETWLASMPETASIPLPQRRVDPSVLRNMLAAVRSGHSIPILYQSMNPGRPEPVWRTISPHAFGSDGFRWHARAYCHLDDKFKDFLLSRCLASRNATEIGKSGESDLLWKEYFVVELMPNPKLSSKQQEVIAFDYDMIRNKLEIPVRRALLYYFHKRLRLDVAGALDNPNEMPVVVANKVDFDKALDSVKA